jgi:hypothetical protein
MLGFFAAVLPVLPGIFMHTCAAAPTNAWERITALGDGFVVWESNRSGSWRIWRRELNGAGLKQLSSDEKGRDHFCPHIAPDGRHVAYLSMPAGVGYSEQKPAMVIPLYVIDADGAGVVARIDNARRADGGNRGVVWIDGHRFIYLDAEKYAREFDLATKKSGPRLLSDAGYLPNRQISYAFDRFHFYPVDRDTRRIKRTGKRYGGCEPYFAPDGKWAVRMSGAGGPISRVDLASGELHSLINKGDSRMPKERGYLYFPMISSCQRLLTFAASPYQHDHNRSDYDVFVALIDSSTLELTGEPVRYTFNSKTDRYPDAFLSRLVLGQHGGEAPFTVTLPSPSPGKIVAWQSGDGQSRQARSLSYTYRRPGDYDVTATVDGKTYRGRVNVRKAEAPEIVAAFLSQANAVRLVFDEPVDISRCRAHMTSGIRVRSRALHEDGRTLDLELEGKVEGKDSLQISAVRDCAQRPNVMAVRRIPLELAAWPHNTHDAIVVFQTGDKPCRSHVGETPRNWDLVRRGLARYDHDYVPQLSGGALLSKEAGHAITAAVRKSNAVTIEAVLSASIAEQQGPARIVSLSRDTGARNFTLGQQGDRLILRMRTPRTGVNGTNPQVDLCPIPVGRPLHVVVTYKPDEIVCYADGQQVLKRTGFVQGDMSNWEPMDLILGDECTRNRDWAGGLEGVAIYNRILPAEEAYQNFIAYRQIRGSRTPVPQAIVEAKLVNASLPPTLKQAAPYREALVTHEYRVTRVRSGELAGVGDKVRVTHWALLDGQSLGAAKAMTGKPQVLVLEPLEANPQITRLFRSDTLDPDIDAVDFFAVGPP